MRLDTTSQITALLGKALDTGSAEQLSVTRWRWNVSGRCTDPVYIERVGRPAAELGKKFVRIDAQGKDGMPTPMTLSVEVVAPCRECKRCLQQRSRLWQNRAKIEIGQAARTWFGTLTIRPQRRFEYLNEARINTAAAGGDFDALNEKQQFFEIHHCVMRDVTLFFKRIRKNSRANIRYMLVTERHKSGDEHLHLLLHEPTLSDAVRKAELEATWHHGFSHWRVIKVDGDDAIDRIRYVTKYLSKDKLTRVRSSLKYGRAETSAVAPKAKRNTGSNRVCVSTESKRPTSRDHSVVAEVPANTAAGEKQ